MRSLTVCLCYSLFTCLNSLLAKPKSYLKHVGILHNLNFSLFQDFDFKICAHKWSLKTLQGQVVWTFITSALDSPFFLAQGGLFFTMSSDEG